MSEYQQTKIETVQEASEKSFSMWKRNMLWTALIVATFIVYSLVRSTPANVSLGKDAVTITYQDKSVTTLSYDGIREATLLEDADFGQPLSGGVQAGGGWSGKWRSEEWGDYMLMIHPGLTYSIRLDTDASVYVISGTTDEETQAWYDSLQSLIP